MKITGTFLDEISMDIPSQNWGLEEWDREFAVMKSVGIDTAIMIRCGLARWMTYPSRVLLKEQNGFMPPADLVRMFLDLAEKHDIAFYFGLYDTWEHGNASYARDLEISLKVADEAWGAYGSSPAFKGWYITWEAGRNSLGMSDCFARMGRHCKVLSGGLPVLISPYIEGRKILADPNAAITPEQHEKEWGEIMAGISGAVDIVAFQDGHVDFHELSEFLQINSSLAQKHGLTCWTNTETFDRDMPIKFPPIKWEKLLLKLTAALEAGVEKAITFEFPHFMSPNSCYPQAHGLFRRYCEHYGVYVPGFGDALARL